MQSKIFRNATQNCVFFALGNADALMDEGDWKRAITQIRAALRYSPSYRVVRSASRIVLLDGSKFLVKAALSQLMGKKRKSPA